jgi:hypothetical protein
VEPEQAAREIRDALGRTGSPRSTIDFDAALEIVCTATGWPIGHAWVAGPTGWRSSGAWHVATAWSPVLPRDVVTGLREATAVTDLGSGRGIVAAVLHLESSRFLAGLQGLGSPLRRQHATALGLRGIVGVPVHATVAGHRKVVAVLEFLTAEDPEPDGALAEALLAVAARCRRTRRPRTRTGTHTAVVALPVLDDIAG